MKIAYNDGNKFEYTPAPVGMHLGQVVDLLDPVEQVGQYGPRTVTRFIIEIPVWKDEEKGWRFTVRTKPMTLKLSEKSALYQFTKDVLGRDLTDAEKKEFDPESLIGQWVDVVVSHTEVEGKVYDNIKYLGATTQPNPPKWETTYVRQKDRPVQNGEPSAKEVAAVKVGVSADKTKETAAAIKAKFSPVLDMSNPVVFKEEQKDKYKKMFADAAAKEK